MLETRTQPAALERPLWDVLAINWEKALYAVILLAAVVTRFYDLGARVMSHDESLHTYFSWNLYTGRGFQHSPLMHGPLQFHLIALSYWLFGDNDFTARIPAALFGAAAVVMPYFFRKWLGRAGALATSALMLISPFLMYYSRYVRNESLVVVWALLMALAVFRYAEERQTKWLYVLAAVTSLLYATKEVSYIYVAIWMLFLGVHFLRELMASEWPREGLRQAFLVAVALALVAAVATGAFFALGKRAASAGALTGTAVPLEPGAAATATAAPEEPYVRAASVAAGAAAILLGAGAALALLAFGREMRQFPSLDLLVILGTFVLPQLAPFPVKALGWDPLDYSIQGMQRTALVLVPLLAVAAGIGLLWDWRKWLISAGIFYGLYITLFTTVFTNGGGLATGMVGSLGYWLVQQGVKRGNQPWYYYLALQLPIYEFLPLLGGLGAGAAALWKWIGGEGAAPARAGRVNGDRLTPAGFPAVGFIGFWAVASAAAYSTAGEKMPWLTVHLTLPLILLAGWLIGRLLDGVDWQAQRERGGWAALALTPVFVVALSATVGSLLGTDRPFQGRELAQLQATSAFIASTLVAWASGVGLWYVGRGLGWRNLGHAVQLVIVGLLALLTARAAVFATFINYDYATEYLVYAHGAPGVRRVMEQVEAISKRTTDGLDIRVSYDDDVSWPITWYMRNLKNQVYYGGQPTRESLDSPLVIAGDNNWTKVEPLLGDRYYRFEYIRMWWPMQEYFNLSWPRIKGALMNPDYREALLDIWLYRNYTPYGTLTNTDYSLSRWPVSDRMRLYVRKDIAAQIWDYGVGPAALGEAAPEDPYARSKQVIGALAVIGSEGQGEGQLLRPRALALAADGGLYVADTDNHRIQQFDADGRFVRMWGAFGDAAQGAGPGLFNQPWGVAVDSKGNVYVADTWNHRIQQFDSQGNYLTGWGFFGTADNGLLAFWGPRGLAVDAQDRLYVADTGNKRILVFDEAGAPLGQIGSVGSLDGQLDEPTDIAVAPDGRVFVADAWNQRVQVFSNTYQYLAQWPIAGWYGQSLDNKPYVALDGQGRVYVTDPEGYRVLVFNSNGDFITTWGDFGADVSTFALPTGIEADADGNIWVADSLNSRLMKFASLLP